jgi:hypothetical protein
MSAPVDYPVTLTIDQFEGTRDKLTTFFRPFVAIPIVIILALLGGSTYGWEQSPWSVEFPVAGLVILPTILMLLFRHKYPRWWFDWNLAISRFALRVGAYMTLLRDEYPSTDEEQAVHLEIPYPDAEKELSSGLPLVKWFLAIPHLVILSFLSIAVFVCVVAAWLVILFTGKYPASLSEFVVGFFRWELRVAAYAFLLTTDKYPPFSLD